MRKFLYALPLLLLCSCPSLHELISSYGFVELRPPSKLFAPGTLVWIQNTSPFQAGIICSAKRALGDDFVPQESLTMNRAIQKAAKKGFSLKADVQSLATGELALDDVESITLSFKNSKVVSLSDSDIQDLAYQRRDARCIRAVELRKAAGFEVTMISEALQADVDYAVNWSRGSKLSVDAKIAQLQQLSAHLGLDANSTTDKTMSGTGLYFGTKDDAFLSWLWLPEQLPKADRGSMILDPQETAEVDEEQEDSAALDCTTDSACILPAKL